MSCLSYLEALRTVEGVLQKVYQKKVALEI